MSRAKELVVAFDVFNGKYRREEVEEALTLQEEITPLLISILDDIAADPVRYMDEDRHAEAYAVALLAHFREKNAHLPIIRAFSIPNEQRDYIWGDMLTETLPALLCRTADGDYSAVMELARDRNAYEYLRASAMEALKLGIASGDLPREEGIALFATLFDESLAEPEEYFWASLVIDLLDLHTEELITEIRDLYAKGFVFEGEISLGDVEQEMAQGYDAAMARLKDKLDWILPEDVHRYISWFACFQEQKKMTPSPHVSPLKAMNRQKEKSRNNRKQAKASKRKNRR
ncbi:MAG: DUF1186 domain-containing protein [Proteobacteria bacterium]|nr:DUF1186 domain-containing protein [Pseudomonadota bacterium]